MINEKLLRALKATVTNTDHAYLLWGDALAVVAEELAKDTVRAAAVRDALIEHLPPREVAGCYHPRSCSRCGASGTACGEHGPGSIGHEPCTGQASR